MNSRSSAPCQRCSETILTSDGARQKRQTGRFPAVGPNQEHTLQIAITGASGLIGTALTRRLSPEHRIVPLVRRPPGPGEIRWDPEAGTLDPAALAGVEAVVHLAGEDIAVRWTEDRKRSILASRSRGTDLLARAMAASQPRPRVLVSASAIGYYGERGEETVTEASTPGSGFLPEVVAAWEQATGPAAAAGIRVVKIRIGLLLTPAGGLLARMLVPFRLGAGGRLGSGNQWMSWIAMDDLLEVFVRGLTDDGLSGPVNAVAPEPVRNREFTQILAGVLHRPALAVVPRFALRLLYGEMADEAILASTRVAPAVLTGLGFRFREPALAPALSRMLGEPA